MCEGSKENAVLWAELVVYASVANRINVVYYIATWIAVEYSNGFQFSFQSPFLSRGRQSFKFHHNSSTIFCKFNAFVQSNESAEFFRIVRRPYGMLISEGKKTPLTYMWLIKHKNSAENEKVNQVENAAMKNCNQPWWQQKINAQKVLQKLN